MELEKLISECKKWCKENSMFAIDGIYSEGKNLFEIELDLELDTFLKLAKTNGVHQVIIHAYEFDDENFKDAKTKSATFNDENLMGLLSPIFESSKEKNGRIYLIKLFWVKDGAMYFWTKRADWIEEYEMEFEEIVTTFLEDKFEQNKDKLLYNDDKQLELINKIAKSELYLAYSTRPSLMERLHNEIIRDFDQSLEEHEISALKRIIKSRVESEFENNHRTEAENNLSYKIRDMIDLNRTKVDIIRTLNLTDGLYQKYK